MIITISGLAVEIYDELNPPSGYIDTDYISAWLISHVPNLNLLTQSCYVYDYSGAQTNEYTGVYGGASGDILTGNFDDIASGNYLTGVSGDILSGFSGIIPVDIGFTPDLSGIDKAIYKEMFNAAYWQRGINSSLGAAGYDSWTEIREFDTSIKRISKNELAKSYTILLKNSQDTLKLILSKYNQLKTLPLQVVGTDALVSCNDYLPFCGIGVRDWRQLY